MKDRFLGGLRLFGLVFIVALLCSATTGCALFHKPDAAFVAGMDAGLNQSKLLDEYEKYVDADPNFKDPDSKKIRHKTAADLRKLISDAQAK